MVDKKDKLEMDLETSYMITVEEGTDNEEVNLLEEILEDKSTLELTESDSTETIKNSIHDMGDGEVVVIKGYNKRSKDEQEDLSMYLKGYAERSNSADLVVYYTDISPAFHNPDLSGRIYSIR